MVVLRTRPKGAELAPFGLAALLFVLGSTSIGYQDLGAWIAPQSQTSERWRERAGVSPFGAEAAVFRFPRPVGTAMPGPEGFRLASFAPGEAEVTGSVRGDFRLFSRPDPEAIPYPVIDRSRKGDFLGPRHRPDGASQEGLPPAPPALDPQEGEATPAPGAANESDELEAAARSGPAASDLPDAEASAVPAERLDELAEFGAARIYFDGGPTGAGLVPIEPWAVGEAPILMLPRAAADADGGRPTPDASKPLRSGDDERRKPGTTFADRDLPDDGRRPKTPSEHLGLQGKTRAKAERCLANAVYFEARSEPIRGQIGVAQVVLNRAFSGYYPEDVCGVVYQNANRHLSCQFTFACDGIPDVVTEPEEWERAKRIARETLDGKLWLREVGKATHYHASYVYPYWVRSMRRMTRIGLHSFYRPRAWGDGADEIVWGNALATAEAARSM